MPSCNFVGIWTCKFCFCALVSFAFYSSFGVWCWSYRSFATRIYDFSPELWYSYFARWHCFMTCFSPFWPSLVSHLHHLHQLFYLHHLFYLHLMFFFPFSFGSSFGLEASLYQLVLLIDWMNAWFPPSFVHRDALVLHNLHHIYHIHIIIR